MLGWSDDPIVFKNLRKAFCSHHTREAEGKNIKARINVWVPDIKNISNTDTLRIRVLEFHKTYYFEIFNERFTRYFILTEN